MLTCFDDEPRIEVLEVPEEIEVPLPPVEVQRPSIPIAAEFTEVMVSDEADPEETIQDTEVDITNPTAARLNYIDPGSGTLLLQILLAGFIAGGLFLRNGVMAFFRLFRRQSNGQGLQHDPNE